MRYQFQSQQTQFTWNPRRFSDAIKVLIIINLGMYLLQKITVSQLDMIRIFGLSTKTIWPLIWQPITYMFMHGGVWHVAINMFVLWMFGTELETIWGKKEFLKYYFVTGFGAGMIWLFFNIGGSDAILIGASGAVYGILMAYGLMFPNRTVYVYFLFPVKVKWFVLFIGAVAFFSSMGTGSNISHLTHLSGMLIGYLYLRFSDHWRKITFNFRKKIIELKSMQKSSAKQKKMKLQQEIDMLLDKANNYGWDSLSEEEQQELRSSGWEVSSKRPKD
ncbi:MAG: rhomboid family intramembrane serine protease [Candidatus Neomarinimicrobiota bacterium]